MILERKKSKLVRLNLLNIRSKIWGLSFSEIWLADDQILESDWLSIIQKQKE